MRRAAACLIAACLGALAGCADPLARDATETLRNQIVRSSQRQIRALEPGSRIEVTESAGKEYLKGQPKRIKELDQMSGPQMYRQAGLELGTGLVEKASKTVSLSLERAVRKAVRHNLDVKLARIQPAISEAEIVEAEAAFDATFFTTASFRKTDQPQAEPLVRNQAGQLIPVGRDTQVRDTASLTTGIRKPLQTGGQVEVSTALEHVNNKTAGLQLRPDPAATSNVRLRLQQPLLRNFGALVNRARIMISRNAKRSDVLQLHQQLLTSVADTERAYWELVRSRHALAIQERLLERTIETRDTLKKRAEYDVNPVQMAQAQAFVEQRRNAVIRARARVRAASDELKRLMHDPELPLSGEALIVPTDEPTQQPVEYSLIDAVTTALRHRPEVRRALLSIDDASIRQRVADNQRLPLLNLNAQVQYTGLSGEPDNSFDNAGEGAFIDYLLRAQFEAPIGNREAEARYRRARLQRRQSVVQYKKSVQQVVQSVKTALRDMRTAYRLISVNRSARRAAAENLRALLEREEKGEALTPEFLLDLKLNTQQRLADAEQRELNARVDYNVALAQLYRALGTLLEHNQIQMNWPRDMFQDSGLPMPDPPAGVRDSDEQNGGKGT